MRNPSRITMQGFNPYYSTMKEGHSTLFSMKALMVPGSDGVQPIFLPKH